MKRGIHTTAIHTGMELAPRDVTPPIRMANTYLFESAEEAAHAFETESQLAVNASELPIYTRWGNPTIEVLERKVAALEGAEKAVATASGMAAVSAALLAALQDDGPKHVVATTGLYSGTYHFVTKDLPRFGVETTLAEATVPEAFEAAIRPETRAIYLETPGNPTLALNDLAAIADIARARGILTIIDNTFATPVNQRPLDLGIDVVVHSATRRLLALWRSMRSGSVVIPRAMSHALNGLMQPPKLRTGPCSTRLTKSAGPATAPPMASPCPPRNLVAEWTTTSMPRSMGRWLTGVAKVLSMIVRMPRARAIPAMAAMSFSARVGFPGVSR